MKSLIIRDAIEKDLPQILDLLKLKFEFDGTPDSSEGTLQNFKDAWFSENPDAYCLVAELDDDIIGIATYYKTFSTLKGKIGLWLDDLFVIESQRSNRIGSKLIKRLAQIARENDYARIQWTVSLHNERGISFYEKNFATIGHNSRNVLLNKDGILRMTEMDI